MKAAVSDRWHLFKKMNCSIVFSVQKTIKYPANAISWFLADISMYSSSIFVFYILGFNLFEFGGYNNHQIMLYLANAFLINNLFAVFFSEGIDSLSSEIWNGKLFYSLLKPKALYLYYISRNINLKSFLSTPFLAVFWIYSIHQCSISITMEAILSIIIGTIVMGLLFLLLTNANFLGFRSDSLSPIMIQLLTLRERPDKVFQHGLRNIFIYLIPIFLTSALPTQIQLGIADVYEKVWFLLAPLVLFIIYQLIFQYCIHRYCIGTEH